ncbi:MAG: nucleic acid binding OB-fold tRNA/helicase-type [Acidimicrobiales bacterium]|nr:nucleic acid binding OB-fold tRNA/helicase-type [Acidimicrobiales bacterium]
MTSTLGRPPAPLPAEPAVPLPPDSSRYRLKRKLLGPPLNTEDLEHERLGRPTALAVFASDNLSSSAYATEEILRVLVPVIGVAAFALVVPITIAMLVVLAFLILSYRETIKAYPTAGGAYMVTRDNFGIMPAQIAGVSLLTDYILTVAVSVAAGTAALVSAAPALKPYTVEISVAFIVVIAYGNLRGVKESGRVFAVPTFFFIVNMILLIGLGVFRMVSGGLPQAAQHQEGLMKFGSAGDGLLLGAGLYVVLHAFASGGAAVTGVEAISNGVPAFRKPEWKNARSTLVVMGSLLGAMFLGLSVLAAKVHAAPFAEGTPTVISQVGKLVYGSSLAGHTLFYALQAGTMLILVLAANTSFADFPRLASFHAGDNFMPRQLTKRGHRLVFSNGIIFLAAAAVVLVIVTQAKVDRLIPLYAIGVFTSFTLSQAGMAKHHLTHREPKWRSGLFVNGVGAILSLIVDLIIAVTKFTHGAWVIVILVPVMVYVLARLNRRYEEEAEALATDVPLAATAPVLRRHVVLVFVDTLDLAAARAIQYARTLHPSDLRAVHFALDLHHAEDLAASWRQLGLSGIPLEIVECPDRRLTKAAVETVALDLADGETEVSVLLPDRKYRGVWGRLLHDRTADGIEREVSKLAHANVTTVPFHLDGRRGEPVPALAPFVATPADERGEVHTNGNAPRPSPDERIAIAQVQWRQRVCVEGRIRSMRILPLADVPSLECVLTDGTGSLSVIFHGRREIPGIAVGTRLQVRGTAIDHHGRLAILNPGYTLVARDG